MDPPTSIRTKPLILSKQVCYWLLKVGMEVCVDTVESAVNAVKGGASRLELCSALNEGGLTPTVGLLKSVKSFSTIPVFVMLRPRGGNDFVFSECEIQAIIIDAQVLKENGADGFVFGALTKDRKVDKALCEMVLNTVKPLPVTFHRAFDLVTSPEESIETIIKLGFSRILTSGQQQSAFIGIKLIKQLIEQSNGRIIIVPGAGINKSNLLRILSETKATEFHASARCKKIQVDEDSPCELDSKLSINLGSDLSSYLSVTHLETVIDMVNIYNCFYSKNK